MSASANPSDTSDREIVTTREVAAPGRSQGSRAADEGRGARRPGRPVERRALGPEERRTRPLFERQRDPAHPVRAAHPRPLLRGVVGNRARLPGRPGRPGQLTRASSRADALRRALVRPAASAARAPRAGRRFR